MDAPTRTLYGRFPRAVGVTTPGAKNELRQYLVHTEAEFDGVVEQVGDERNLYASISAFEPVRDGGDYAGNAVVVDKVSFDLDSSAKAAPNADRRWAHTLLDDSASDREVVRRMRADPDVRDAVLGDVIDDGRRLARAALDEGVPVAAVFSGLGLHVHLLYAPTRSRPERKLQSNANRWLDEVSLPTADGAATGRPFRILRVPNVQRVDGNTPLGLYQVPLSGAELKDITTEELLELSTMRRPTLSIDDSGRPALKTLDEYVGPRSDDVGQEQMHDLPEEPVADDLAATIVEEVTKMPCVFERAVGGNPPNDVRVQVGSFLLSAGYSPAEAADVIAGLRWVDYDRDVTLYQLEKLQENDSGTYSCETMMQKGLCARADDPESCPMYGYRGGDQPRNDDI